MGTILLFTHDQTLGALCTEELVAIHQPAPRVLSPDAAIPQDARLLLFDLDTCAFPKGRIVHPPVIGITRRETLLPPEVLSACAVILHRPFPIALFREAVLRLLAPKSTDSTEREKRHRVTTKRTSARKEMEELRFSETKQALLYGSQTIPLTPGEATVFLALSEADGAPVSRETLLARLQAERESNLPDVHVCAIRKKLVPHGLDTRISTVRGTGYRLLKG